MAFTDPRFVLVPGLRTESFVLRPITADDAERDHEAVMESRDYLHAWEQSTWPEDDFSVEDNRGDLVDLEAWNADRKAFTYTILDPNETVCLGCVYIFPTDATFLQTSEITPVRGDTWTDFDAVVYHWVRKSQMDTGKDAELLTLLREWLARDWEFDTYLFVTNEQFEAQAELIRRNDMALRFTFAEGPKPDLLDKPGKFLAFTDESARAGRSS